MEAGFDNSLYIHKQTEHIRQRIAQWGGKLYLEFGGKLFDDYHAARVLPGFDPNGKIRLLYEMREQAEIIFTVSAGDIEKTKMRADLGISYDMEVLRLIDDITHAQVTGESIINRRYYHTIKETKNGEGPHPIKTPRGWLHLAHGVRTCAAGLRYVLYLYMTELERPWIPLAEPAGMLLGPLGEERTGDVSNVLFSNGWIADPDGRVCIYYASCDTRMHVATSTVGQLVDYCLHTPADGFTTGHSVETLKKLIDKNLKR